MGARGGGLRSPSVAGLMGRNCEAEDEGPLVGERQSPVDDAAVDIFFLLGERDFTHPRPPDGKGY